MRKTLVTVLCSALIAASSIQVADAAEHHHIRKASRKPVMVNDQHRNSNNEQPRDFRCRRHMRSFSWPMPMRNRGGPKVIPIIVHRRAVCPQSASKVESFVR